MAITLPKETRKALLASITHFFSKERDEEIGALAADLFLDFIIEEIGPYIYNQGIRDAQGNLLRVVADLDINLCVPEPAR